MKVQILAIKKVLCISLQYVNVSSGKVMQHLLQLLELDATRGTASDLFASFKNFLMKIKLT